MADVSTVVNHWITAQEGFTTTTSGTVSSGAATVGLNSVAGYTNGDIVAFVIDPTTASKQAFTGVVDTAGVQITSVKWTEGTNTSHLAGATVVDYTTATHQAALVKGLKVSHNQDGTIKNNAITTAAQITDGVIGNAEMATAVKPITLFDETTFDFVASGCVWTADAAGSTLLGSMTAGVVYIDGNRVAVSAVTAHAFTASKDTYVDVGTDGVVDYSESTLNAASQALAASHLRLGIIVTGASSIANVGAVNQGQEDKVLPIASSIPYQVTDSLGNLICPRDPNRRLLGLRRITSNFAPGTGAQTAVTGLSVPVIVPTNRRVIVSAYSRNFLSSGIATSILTVWDGAVGGTAIADGAVVSSSGGFGDAVYVAQLSTPATASKTYNVSCQSDSGNTTVGASSTSPAFVKVELA